MLVQAITVSVALLVAYANGANDVSKGVATLVGSGVTEARRAIGWGTAWTAAGALAGAFAATALARTFGAGLLTPGTTPTLVAALATIVAAATWVILATFTGLPVSTTHALIGALSGVAAFAYGIDHVRWSAVLGNIAVPLVASPVVAIAATTLILRLRPAAAPVSDCVCVATTAAAPAGAVGAAVVVACERACNDASLEGIITVTRLHWLTSGATSFARGMNDAPKIAAIVLGASLVDGRALSSLGVFALVATGMVAGSLLSGLRVTRVLAEDVTRMDHHEGFVANLVTSLLVGSGAVLGMPMSTTHVSTAAIAGAGLARPQPSVTTKTLRDLALAWIVTLPASALIGVLLFAAFRQIVSH
ncbi:MAG: inorganic phosphate transporter [Deltaproteobacteria bacterium]|nr:inorganic phosphate transporter [Deltaproteobacteria bacterium]